MGYRFVAIAATALLALATLAGPALAWHKHDLVTPGTVVEVPCEPTHVTGEQGDALDPPLVHPVHERLHKGPGAPSDETTVTPDHTPDAGNGDPVLITTTFEECYPEE